MKHFLQYILLLPEFSWMELSLTQRILIYDKFVTGREILSFAGEVNHG
jgi:hypothetical protein